MVAAFTIFTLPARWMTERAQSLFPPGVAVHAVHGTLGNGGGTLVISALRIAEPVQWQVSYGDGLHVALGGGALIVRPQSAYVTAPIAIEVRTPQIVAPIRIDTLHVRNWPAVEIVNARAAAPTLFVQVAAHRIALNDVVLRVENNRYALNAKGDLAVTAEGIVNARTAPRLTIDARLEPQANATPQLTRAIAQILPTHPSGGYRYSGQID